jgi:3'-5' exoribonuclease 1
MHYIICDLEATCWADVRRPERMEIIEIGAVKLAAAGGPVLGEFSTFVRPTLEPTLSDYCRELTSITQADVDNADPFPVVLERFLAWMGEPPLRFCSWGQYDLNQLRLDCDRHKLTFPAHFADHLNVKNAWAAWKGVKPRGLARSLRLMGMELEGRHHRGMDDARNIARICIAMGEGWAK